ncbi:suppressor protein SRP40-like [Venturia canescens]|uniref:suppressor protein SRP40-like n=1 Tax=Venturia canescens TaxID=32260 RepID=UPI001C9CB244|nr:suppressor protein SRP40-like [Venturia canescens]
MAPTRTRVTKEATKKKRGNKNCCADTSSSSSASSNSSSSSDSSYTTSDCVYSSDTESSDCDCSNSDCSNSDCLDGDCSDCWECECVPQRKRGGKHKKIPSPKVSKAVDRDRKNKKHTRRPKYASSSDESSCGSSDDCYGCEPKKPGRKARV